MVRPHIFRVAPRLWASLRFGWGVPETDLRLCHLGHSIRVLVVSVRGLFEVRLLRFGKGDGA